jgi:hypothetical protein
VIIKEATCLKVKYKTNTFTTEFEQQKTSTKLLDQLTMPQ